MAITKGQNEAAATKTNRQAKTGKTGTKKRKNPKARRHTRIQQLANAINRLEKLVLRRCNARRVIITGVDEKAVARVDTTHQEFQVVVRRIRNGFQPCWWPS